MPAHLYTHSLTHIILLYTPTQLCEIYRALALGTAEFETEAPLDIVVVRLLFVVVCGGVLALGFVCGGASSICCLCVCSLFCLWWCVSYMYCSFETEAPIDIVVVCLLWRFVSCPPLTTLPKCHSVNQRPPHPLP